jgi:Ca2+-binding RTX toxin-like protein
VISDPAATTTTTTLIAHALKPFAHVFTLADGDGDALSASLENAPAWLTLTRNDGGSVEIAGTPDVTNLGVAQTVTLVVSDGQETVRRDIDISVPAFRFRLDDAGKLAVVGTAAADQVSISLRDAATLRLLHNGYVKTFPLAGVKAIEVYALDGNDAVSINSGGIPVYVLGGAGNDTLSGGDEVDNFVGGGGKDYLSGGLGNDRLNGHNGNDTLLGNDGDDRLYGGDANDILVGGNGKDRCYGEAGDDLLITRGDRKADLLYGGAGTNTASYDALLDHLTDVLA